MLTKITLYTDIVAVWTVSKRHNNVLSSAHFSSLDKVVEIYVKGGDVIGVQCKGAHRT